MKACEARKKMKVHKTCKMMRERKRFKGRKK